MSASRNTEWAWPKISSAAIAAIARRSRRTVSVRHLKRVEVDRAVVQPVAQPALRRRTACNSGLPQTLATRWPRRQPLHSSARSVQARFHSSPARSSRTSSGTPVEPDVFLRVSRRPSKALRAQRCGRSRGCRPWSAAASRSDRRQSRMSSTACLSGRTGRGSTARSSAAWRSTRRRAACCRARDHRRRIELPPIQFRAAGPPPRSSRRAQSGWIRRRQAKSNNPMRRPRRLGTGVVAGQAIAADAQRDRRERAVPRPVVAQQVVPEQPMQNSSSVEAVIASAKCMQPSVRAPRRCTGCVSAPELAQMPPERATRKDRTPARPSVPSSPTNWP